MKNKLITVFSLCDLLTLTRWNTPNLNKLLYLVDCEQLYLGDKTILNLAHSVTQPNPPVLVVWCGCGLCSFSGVTLEAEGVEGVQCRTQWWRQRWHGCKAPEESTLEETRKKFITWVTKHKRELWNYIQSSTFKHYTKPFHFFHIHIASFIIFPPCQY